MITDPTRLLARRSAILFDAKVMLGYEVFFCTEGSHVYGCDIKGKKRSCQDSKGNECLLSGSAECLKQIWVESRDPAFKQSSISFDTECLELRWQVMRVISKRKSECGTCGKAKSEERTLTVTVGGACKGCVVNGERRACADEFGNICLYEDCTSDFWTVVAAKSSIPGSKTRSLEVTIDGRIKQIVITLVEVADEKIELV